LTFLDKSRSAQSKTHSTSGLPAPALAPATIEFSSKSSSLISKLHEENLDPNNLFFCNAHDDASFKRLSQFMLPFLKGRDEALTRLLQESRSGEYTYVSGKVKSLWESKQQANSVLLEVFVESDKDSAQLDPEARKKREEYFEAARLAWKVNLKEGLTYINEQIAGPYVLGKLQRLPSASLASSQAGRNIILGDQPSLADMHLAAWFARVAFLAGAQYQDNSIQVLGKIQQRIGDGFKLPEDFETTRPSGFGSDQVTPTATAPGASSPLKVRQARLAAFWDAFSKRQSWEKVYGKAGLY
jgi:hypothetical protein